MSGPDSVLEVWLDGDLGPPCLVGTLAHDRGQVRFRYEREWLGDARAFALDPELTLDEAPFFPKPELGNFGIFLDSSPDRWGQTLMKRREALQAKDEKRTSRTLYACEGTSYLELAKFLRSRGDGPHTDADLGQLFRRVAFNVAVGNWDDHLRNHGFVLGATGWRLAPAFDVNPNIDKAGVRPIRSRSRMVQRMGLVNLQRIDPPSRDFIRSDDPNPTVTDYTAAVAAMTRSPGRRTYIPISM